MARAEFIHEADFGESRINGANRWRDCNRIYDNPTGHISAFSNLAGKRIVDDEVIRRLILMSAYGTKRTFAARAIFQSCAMPAVSDALVGSI
jgi:hypothetical protein